MALTSDKGYELTQGMQKLYISMKPRNFIKGIKPTQMMVMMCVYHNTKDEKTTTPSVICEELGLSKSALSAILNILEEKALIERHLSSDDRRMLILKLTDGAINLIGQYHDKIHKSIQEFTEYLGNEDTDEFIRLVNKANKFFAKD